MEILSKNLIWMAAANTVSSLFGIILFIYLARTLMPEGFGYLSYCFTLVFFLANFIDLGLSTYGVREISRDRDKASEYLSQIVSFRIIIASLLAFAFIIAILIFCPSNTLKILMVESSLLFLTFALAAEWAFQAIEKMHMIFVSFAVTSILQLGLIRIFVRDSGDLLKAPALYFLATLPMTIVFLRILKFKLRIRSLDLKRIMGYLSSSLIIWTISILAQIYNGLDVLMLGMFRTADEVGCFTIARRFVGAVALLMIFLANAVLPRLASTFDKEADQFKSTTRKFLRLAMIFTIFLLLPILLFSRQLISMTVGDEYIPATLPFRIMIAGLILVIFNLPYSTGLIAARKELDVLKQAGASAVLSVIANLLLIPRYGMTGAAISFLLAEMLAFLWITRVYRKRIQPLI